MADTTAPAAPYVASAAPGSAAGSLNIIWMNTGDDGNSGNITGGAFKIAYSTLPGTVQNMPPQITQSASLTAGTTQGYTMTGLTEGVTYYVAVKLADEVPNWSALSAAVTGWAQVSVSTVSDHNPPSVIINYPHDGYYYNSVTSLVGVAADDVDVSSVQVSVKNLSNGLYWTGSAWGASQTWLAAAYSAGGWVYASTPSWVSDMSYAVVARAADTSGNWSVVYGTSTFVFDNTKPFAKVFSPARGAAVAGLTQISGTAYDAVDVLGVQVAVKRLDDGKYWTGSVWDSTPAWNLAEGTTNWVYSSISTAALTAGATYVAMCRANDYAGNLSSTNDSSTFTYTGPAPAGVLSAIVGSVLGTGSVQWSWNYGGTALGFGVFNAGGCS